MRITKRFALRKTRIHSDDISINDPTGELPWIDIKAYAPKGTVYYQISNGTIGKGAMAHNMSERAMRELLASDAWAWKKDMGAIEKKHATGLHLVENIDDTDNAIYYEPIKRKEVKEPCDIDNDYQFTADDIPF